MKPTKSHERPITETDGVNIECLGRPLHLGFFRMRDHARNLERECNYLRERVNTLERECKRLTEFNAILTNELAYSSSVTHENSEPLDMSNSPRVRKP